MVIRNNNNYLFTNIYQDLNILMKRHVVYNFVFWQKCVEVFASIPLGVACELKGRRRAAAGGGGRRRAAPVKDINDITHIAATTCKGYNIN